MNKQSRYSLFLVSAIIMALFLPFSSSFSWFEEFRQSTRGKAMSNSLGTTWEGVEAMYYNPAALAHLKSADAMMSYSQPGGGFSNFDDGSTISQIDFAAAFPFNNPINLRTAGWKNDFITTNAGFGFSYIQQIYDSGDGTAMVAQRYVGITYAKNLDNIIFQGARLSMGITNNIYLLSFEGTDVTNNAAFANTKGAAWSPDVGVTYNFSDFIKIALVYENIVPTSPSPFEEDGEPLTSQMKLGLSYELGSIGKFPFLQDILVVGEWRIINPPYQGKNVNSDMSSLKTYHAGWESWYKIPGIMDIAARTGFAVGSQSYSETGMGIGLSRYFDHRKRYRGDINFTWIWSSFASSMAADHRFYVGGVFHYYFPDRMLPGYQFDTKIKSKVIEDTQDVGKKKEGEEAKPAEKPDKL